MRYPEDNDAERENDMRNYAVEPWMMDQLDRNWSYLGWGPHEDYMLIGDLSHPNSPRKFPTWAAFRNGFTVGEHPDAHGDRSGGEVVGWYFNLARERRECKACDGSGENPETKRLHDDWYDFKNTGRRWCDNITQDEADALVENSRMREMTHVRSRQRLDTLVAEGRLPAERAEELWEGRDRGLDRHDEDTGELQGVYIQWRDRVPAEEINEANRGPGIGHDAINRWICVRARAERLGVYGTCEKCDGHGHIPVDIRGRLQLVLWIINPLTGQSYGLEVDNIEKDELEDVYDFLQGMRDRLVGRLEVPKAAVSRDLDGFGRGETMMWTQAGSLLERSDSGWASEAVFASWEDFCWPTHYKYGDPDDGHRVPKDHPKFAELHTGEPAWQLDDLNEMVALRFGLDPHGSRIERLYVWMILPRKGASKRVTINNVTERDLPAIRAYALQGAERARERLDPSVKE